MQDTNHSDGECGSQPPKQEEEQDEGQGQEEQQNQQDEQQGDTRQSGRKRKLSPRAAEAAAAAAAQAAADPDGAEIAAEVHAVTGAGGSAAAAAATGVLAPREAGPQCMGAEAQRRNAPPSAQKPKNKRQKAGAAAGDWSGCEGAGARSAPPLTDADMHGLNATARGAGMVTRGHRVTADHTGTHPEPLEPCVPLVVSTLPHLVALMS